LRLQSALLILAIPLALTIPLLPFIVNGAPYIGDAWVHLRIAEETVSRGQYRFEDYNTQWPLVNMLIAVAILVQGMPPLMASQIVPALAGMACLPFYVLCRKMRLSALTSLFGVVFLSFNPLYTYFTFSGAVMKETASYYLVLSLLMFASLKTSRLKEGYLAGVLLGVGLVLGHHFGAMIVALFFLSLAAYRVAEKLTGKRVELKLLGSIGATYLLLFVIRNLIIYQSIGAWIPEFTFSDLLILSSCLVFVWALGFSETKWLLALRLVIVSAAFVICLLFLRGGVLAVLTPVDPMTISELRNYVVAGGVSILGLVYALKRAEARSLAVPAVGWVLFAFIFSLTEEGLIVFTKALHYFGVLLAIGAAYAASVVSRRFRMGKIIILLVVIFLTYSSFFGTAIALRGLGAYSTSEVSSVKEVIPQVDGISVHGDVKISYLWSYLTKGKSGVAGIMSLPKRGELMIVMSSNRQTGFLLGYQWASSEAVLQRLVRYNVVVNSPDVAVLAVV
jgi:hypothetical protein